MRRVKMDNLSAIICAFFFVAIVQPQPQQQYQAQQQPQYQPQPQQPEATTSYDFNCKWCMRPKCNPGGCQPAPNFDAKKDAKDLLKAMEEDGNKESVLMEILTHRSEEQLEQIRQEYTGSGRYLDEDVKDDPFLKMKDLFTALLQRRDEFFATQLKRAFRKHDGDAMVMILTSLSPCAVRQIGSAYSRMFGTSLIVDAKKVLHLNFENFLVELIKGNRDEDDGHVDDGLARKDAEALQKANPKTWFNRKTGSDVFTDIFTQRSYSHIRKVKEVYDQIQSSGLENDIKEHSGGGGLTKELQVMLKNIDNQPEYFTNEIEDAAIPLVGPRFRDRALIPLIRGRCGIDLGDIKEAYPKCHTNKQLEELIKERTSGDYTKAFLELISGNN